MQDTKISEVMPSLIGVIREQRLPPFQFMSNSVLHSVMLDIA